MAKAPTTVYQFTKTIDFIKAWVNSLPAKDQRGAYRRLAKAARVFPSYFSQILKGDRTLNLDQAMGLCEHFGFRSEERRYFFRLVELERAQTAQLKAEIRRELDDLRSAHHQISAQIPHQRTELRPEELQVFYSSWHYVATRLLTSIPNFKDAKSIAGKIGVSEEAAQKILRFLLETGLCQESSDGINVGPTHMHLDHQSPLVRTHHANWRVKAITQYPMLNHNENVAYSFATTLSKQDAIKIRSMILDFISEVRAVSDPSAPEELYFLNIDWLSV
jgi:uncharacterized protein (TIGR02147 family)